MCAAVARQLQRYVEPPDKIVVDVEPEHEAPEMQVLLASPTGGACWHRRASVPGPADHTACGRKYDWRFEHLGLRMSRYEGDLCADGCFSPWEIEQAQRLKDEARKDRDR